MNEKPETKLPSVTHHLAYACDMALNTLIESCVSAGGRHDRENILMAQSRLRKALADYADQRALANSRKPLENDRPA